MPFRYQGPPPPQRPNWNTLNSAQKKYAIRQYNIGRQRRNLPLYNINNVSGGGEPVNIHELETVFDGDRNEDLDDFEEFNQPSTTGTHPLHSNYQNNIVNTNQGEASNHTLPMSNVSSSSSEKRPADDEHSSGTKKAKNMELPGTGSQGNSDPDTGNPSPENSIIPRPISSSGKFTMVIRKNHSFFSYGLAWKIMGLDDSTRVHFTTTSLMEIPVDRPYLYLSPSEFEALPKNCYVKHLNVKVVMRNPRTAFETNATTTSLATLNQNKFACFGTGLNIKTGGVSRELTFGSSTASMIPQSSKALTKSKREDHVKAMYGTKTNKFDYTDAFESLPHSFLNLPHAMNSYYCLVRDGRYSNVGWPMLSQHMTKADASFLVGKTVIDYSYSPQVSLLTVPHKMVSTRWLAYEGGKEAAKYSDESFGQLAMNQPHTSSAITVNQLTGHTNNGFAQIIDVEESEFKHICDSNPYYAPIEKCQYIKRGMDSVQKQVIQPSVHVGIYPVPRLTTSDLTDIPKNFTDVQVQWDINTEIVLEWTMPHHTMSYEHYHIPMENAYYCHDFEKLGAMTNPCFNDNRSTFRNGYTTLVTKKT